MQRVHKLEKVKKQDCKNCDSHGMCCAENNEPEYQCPKGTELWKKLHSNQNVQRWLG